MPMQKCKAKGRSGTKWGSRGKCYGGPKGKAKALRQMRAIRASGYTGNVFCATDEGVENSCNHFLAYPWEYTVNSSCGAGDEGHPGFREGNTCAGASGHHSIKTSPAYKRAISSPKFKRWFGNSKAVDEAGRPLVLFHGTRGTFKKFNIGGSSQYGFSRMLGAHFAEDSSVTEAFTTGEYAQAHDYSISHYYPEESWYRNSKGQLRYGEGIPVLYTGPGYGPSEQQSEVYSYSRHGYPGGVRSKFGEGSWVGMIEPGGRSLPVFLNIKKPLHVEVNDRESDDMAVSRAVAKAILPKNKALFVEVIKSLGGYNHPSLDPVKVREVLEEGWHNLNAGRSATELGYASWDKLIQSYGGTMFNGKEMAKKAKNALQQLGYDGIKYRNVSRNEVRRGANPWAWIAFRPTQVKSLYNRGSYERGNPLTTHAAKRPVKFNPLRVDPSRTAGLRRAFGAEMKKRMEAFRRELLEIVVKQDAFGLSPRPQLSMKQLTANYGQYAFLTSAEKAKAFLRIIQRLSEKHLLQLDMQEVDRWWAKYSQRAFRDGAKEAYDIVKKARWGKKEGDFYKGAKEEFLTSGLLRPVDVETVKLLSGRIFTDLKGITEAMSTKLSRTLTDGLVQGKHPYEIGYQISQDIQGIGVTRGNLLARTEMVRAKAEGQLTAMEKLQVPGVRLKVEWSVSGVGTTRKGYPSPCPICKKMSGKVFTIEESRGLIPAHPNCMCAWIPAAEPFTTNKLQQAVLNACRSHS